MGISIRELSRISGFSAATVSNALSGKRGVNRQTADTILKLAQEQGYTYAVSTRREAIRLVVYKTPFSKVSVAPFFSQMIDGIEQACAAAGYSLSISNLTAGSDDYQEKLRGILSDSAAAIVLLATDCSEEAFQDFKHAVCPLLYFDNAPSRSTQDAILIDNEDSIRTAVGHLHALGHRRIGFLRSSYPLMNFQRRLNGYWSTLRELGLESSGMEVEIPTLDPTQIPAEITLPEDSSIPDPFPSDLPTAFVSDNDFTALAAMSLLKAKGVRIPEDVSIIGFDDIAYASLSTPRLASIRVPVAEMGIRAIEQLISRMENKTREKLLSPVKVLVTTELIERESVRCLTRLPQQDDQGFRE